MSNPQYKIQNWDTYARSHASVLTSFQWKLYKEACLHLSGDVVDYGCGTAKLAPLLADKDEVSSYTGVDFSPDMVQMARWILLQLKKKNFTIHQEKIEKVSGLYSSAVSIHSYYSWQDTQAALSNIYQSLMVNGRFVLISPNPEMDMRRLLKKTEKELLAHPDHEAFKKLNLLFAQASNVRFITMNELILDVSSVGFKVIECHQRHYLGGVNFLVLTK